MASHGRSQPESLGCPWTVICQSDQCSEHVSFDAPVPSCSTTAESNLLGFCRKPRREAKMLSL